MTQVFISTLNILIPVSRFLCTKCTSIENLLLSRACSDGVWKWYCKRSYNWPFMSQTWEPGGKLTCAERNHWLSFGWCRHEHGCTHGHILLLLSSSYLFVILLLQMHATVCGLCHLHGTMSGIADESLLDAWLILKDEVLEAWSPLGALGHVGKIDGGLLLSNEACATPSRRASNGHSSVW